MTVWPDFFLVGAQKAGTSSLYAYLKQHPDVYLPGIKEPHFFSQVRPSAEYEQIFLRPVLKEVDYQRLFAEAEGFRAVGDASVSYLWDRLAPQRIQAKRPDAKILIVLRDPVERAYSHYLMNIREGVETLPFYEALQRNQEEKSEGWGTSRLYIETGLYAEQVRRYLELFGSEQVCVLLFEDLKRETSKLLQDVACFLDIDPAATQKIDSDEIHNPHLVHRGSLSAAIMRSRRIHLLARACVPRRLRHWARFRLILQPGPKPIPDSSALGMLRALYEPDLQELEALLNKPLPCLRRVK